MSGPTTPGELAASLLAGGTFLLYTWHKRKTQLGRAHPHVRVFASGKALRCHMCDGDLFQKREGLLATTWVTLLKLGSLNESARCLACNSCGYVHWFAQARGVSASAQLRYDGAALGHDAGQRP